ncbi:MAG: proline--tRNA ligase [Actinomycetia bacterium]|nr:proline--tRNA ligase [Actinomycetes bacterium]
MVRVAYMSKMYAPTLKELPAEAEIASHKLSLRAGLIRKSASGIYSFLPLGYRVIKKIEDIVRDEMDAIGCQEVLLPIVQPAELWRESGRWDDYGPELARFNDRHEREFCLGPTHEEIITDMVKGEIRSYRNLPFTLYQINMKFRDEVRPRFGLLRGREFNMKDAYSFHTTQESLQEHYDQQAAAYGRICERLGLDYRPVDADSGQIGGDVSREFMALADAGEAELVYCDCGYGATTESLGEDFDPSIEHSCPKCGAPLKLVRGIEVSQVFQLGTKYSKVMGLTYQDENGVDQFPFMGCYGVGVSRSMAAVIEQSHDDDGIIWPVSIAPYQVMIIALSSDDEAFNYADSLAQQLVEKGVEIVVDDRDERAGVKFADADLLGFPLQVIVGKRGFEAGEIEVKIRKTGEKHVVALDDATTEIKQLLDRL